MVKTNYSAWHVNSQDFSAKWSDLQKLVFFARYAILAPSGHNTQPWQISTQAKTLNVAVNRAHFLSIDGSGLLSVEPYISIGTFIEMFVLAGRGFGYEVAVELFPNPGQVVRFSIAGATNVQPSLLEAIKQRASNRNMFVQTPINSNSLSEITAHNLSGVTAHIITERADINFVAQQTEDAIKSIMSNPLYRKELSSWVRTNFTRQYDGMPGFTHGFGNLKALFAKPGVRFGAKLGPHAKRSAELIQNSGTLVIVGCQDNQKSTFVNAGRLYSHICVLAQNTGLASSALGASVLNSATRDQVKQHFKIAERPVIVLRLGQPLHKARHSPRWPLERLLSP